MGYETLDYSVTDDILTLTLNRPEQLNSFTVTMAEELIAAYDRASVDDEVGAIVVTGAGRAFCAGMDLTAPGNVFGLDETQRPTLEDLHERFEDPAVVDGVRDTGGRVSLAVYRCRKPVIAAINGPAVGIGATMTLPMDVRLASDDARIGFVFGRLGIVPEAASSWFLPRIVGISRALEWVYSAEVLSAQEALDGGLLRSVVPADGAPGHRVRPRAQVRRRALPGRDGADAADDVAQQRRAAPGRGPPGRLARDVLHLPRRRQGGRRRVPREASPRLQRPGQRSACRAVGALRRRSLRPARR